MQTASGGVAIKFREMGGEARKGILADLYLNKKMSSYKIAAYVGMGKSNIYKMLVDFGIPTRTQSEAKMGELHPMYGKHLSVSQKKKLSEASIRNGNHPIVTPEHRRALSKLLSTKFLGSGNPFYGKRHSPEVVQQIKERVRRKCVANGGAAIIQTSEVRHKISIALTGKEMSAERRKHLSEVRTGTHHTEETKNKMRGRKQSEITIAKKLAWWTPERRERHRDMMINRLKNGGMPTSMTRPEKRFIEEYIKPLKLPIKHVGDGQFWVAGCNPDFLNVNGKKEVYEIFGRAVHTLFHRGRYNYTEQGRIFHFAKYGFKCIVIWDDELDNRSLVLQKLGVGEDEHGGKDADV
jgi:hypothetical protein